MNTVTCPVCGMTFDQSEAGATTTYDSQTYYFCSEGCRDQFTANPSAFVPEV